MWRCPYQWRWLKNKGVAVTLLWSFAAFVMVNFIYNYFTIPVAMHSTYLALIYTAFVITFPLAGWLADVYIGRYMVIRASMIIMLLGAVVFNIKSMPVSINLWYLEVLALLLGVIGLSGFQSNIIQFSLDQLFDSSSFEIMSFVLFYVWFYFAAGFVVILIFNCVSESFIPIAELVLPFFLSLAVSSDFLFRHWLVKEPVSRNPLKLILQVLGYAAKNKYPHQRSAFTYWEDKNYSRIDLAKSKYGGPFTTEEVEDVKTFFRISVVVTTAGFFLGVAVGSVNHTMNFANKTKCDADMIYSPGCFKVFVYSGLFAVVGIPVWEFLLSPLLWKCVMKLKSLLKLGLGMIFLMLCLVSRFSFDVFQLASQQGNQTISCSMPTLSNLYGLSYWWLLFPSLFSDLGRCLVLVIGLQFISAQCPYSMKGLMFGVAYLAACFAMCLIYILSIPFQRDGFHSWGGLNCMFWYQLACIVAALVISGSFLVVACQYKNREREEKSPSQQFLADVYSDHMHSDVSMSVSLD